MVESGIAFAAQKVMDDSHELTLNNPEELFVLF